MSKKTAVSLVRPVSNQSNTCEDLSFHNRKAEAECSDVENLYILRDRMFQLREEVNRLSFMMSEIRNVLESSSFTDRFFA